jgi:hypothetical protein
MKLHTVSRIDCKISLRENIEEGVGGVQVTCKLSCTIAPKRVQRYPHAFKRYGSKSQHILGKETFS